MNISKLNLNKITKHLDISITPFFSREELDQLAVETGFVQRTSQLNGSLFLDLLVFNSDNLKNQSLNDLTIILSEQHNVEIAKQSLHERFNESAVTFLQTALEILLRDQLDVEPYMLNLEGIKRILIKDSVCFQIDKSLFAHYPGSGGSGSKASVRIQFEYDLLTGCINDISLNAFNDQDATNAVTTVELVNEGDLIIRDLAYVGLKALKGIVKRIAFYLCRLSPTIYVYEKIDGVYVKINFAKVYADMKKRNMKFIEKDVYIGKEEKFNTRLIIHLMPDEQIRERIRKARLNNKKKGSGELSKEFIARSHLNLFITNTDDEVVPPEYVWKFYQLRWQIELSFKIWKSLCDIEKVKKVSKYRLQCYIYAKLIIIFLGWKFIWRVSKQLFSTEGKAISYYKAFKTFMTIKMAKVKSVFLDREGSVEDFIQEFYLISRKKHLLEKKKGKLTSLEILLSLSGN